MPLKTKRPAPSHPLLSPPHAPPTCPKKHGKTKDLAPRSHRLSKRHCRRHNPLFAALHARGWSTRLQTTSGWSLRCSGMGALFRRVYRSPYRARLVCVSIVLLCVVVFYELRLRPLVGRGDGGGGEEELVVRPPRVGQSVLLGNLHKTLYVIPGKENRCSYQYDYLCKFWFYVRCYIFGAFPSVVVLPSGMEGVSEFQRRARDGDIGMLVWRSKNHSMVPDLLEYLLEWRREGGRGVERGVRVRVGVFHIANEKRRYYWPWYVHADFVVRNYWLGAGMMPQHGVYVPLGGQMPEVCEPGSTMREGRGVCNCGELRVKRGGERRWVWNFGGSLRKRRGKLLRLAGESEVLRGRGLVKVAKRFGGDGEFGGVAGRNPKTGYLEGIMESMFVFAPCGNAMETHRVYEAVMLGAIPVVEECEGGGRGEFFPVKELRVKEVGEMVRFVERYVGDAEGVERLQRRVMKWWTAYAEEVLWNVSRVVGEHVAVGERGTAGVQGMEEWE